MITKALAEDLEPHYTAISNFVSEMSGEIEKIFGQVLMVCNGMGLIKGKMFAIDGCRLPSNASKEWSGTKKELRDKYEKIKKISKTIIEKHQQNDIIGKEEQEADQRKLERLEKNAERILDFLETHEERLGKRGEIIKSNGLYPARCTQLSGYS